MCANRLGQRRIRPIPRGGRDTAPAGRPGWRPGGRRRAARAGWRGARGCIRRAGAALAGQPGGVVGWPGGPSSSSALARCRPGMTQSRVASDVCIGTIRQSAATDSDSLPEGRRGKPSTAVTRILPIASGRYHWPRHSRHPGRTATRTWRHRPARRGRLPLLTLRAQGSHPPAAWRSDMARRRWPPNPAAATPDARPSSTSGTEVASREHMPAPITAAPPSAAERSRLPARQRRQDSGGKQGGPGRPRRPKDQRTAPRRADLPIRRGLSDRRRFLGAHTDRRLRIVGQGNHATRSVT